MGSKTRLVALFLVGRIITFIALPIEGIIGYGDFYNFFGLASRPGWPYLQYWVEFPPVFPFLSSVIYRIAGGQQHVYLYILLFILTAADAGNLILFSRLAEKYFSPENGYRRVLTYAFVLIVLPYSWWYFDPLAVFFMLSGITLLLEGKEKSAGIVFGGGLWIKFFPLIGLMAGWKTSRPWQFIRSGMISLVIGAVVFGGLYLASPDYTRTSLISQAGKGSWETVGALIDGNYRTGAMAAPEARGDIASVADNLSSNPARIPPYITLVLFVILGIWMLSKVKITAGIKSIQVVCFTWALFLIWTPGFSPQWILYLIPLVLLSLPEREGFLFTAVLVLINLAEWPLLLSRGMFWTLFLTVPVRTLLFVALAYRAYQLLKRQAPEIKTLDAA